jgi:hypothetical protein
MFLGPPLPLSDHLPLSALLAHVSPAEFLGVWVRGSAHELPQRLALYSVSRSGCGRVLASADLGLLLARCNRILVRQGKAPVVLPAETLIQWRALQVATATPYLPGVEHLRGFFPGLRATDTALLVPLRWQSPEEVLARCVAEGIQVTASRVVYVMPD